MFSECQSKYKSLNVETINNQASKGIIGRYLRIPRLLIPIDYILEPGKEELNSKIRVIPRYTRGWQFLCNALHDTVS